MKKLTCLVAFLIIQFSSFSQNKSLTGAWENLEAEVRTVEIIADHYFAKTKYHHQTGEFISTSGGTWKLEKGNKLVKTYQFNTADTSKVGQTITINVKWNKDGRTTTYDGKKKQWTQLDATLPGYLYGAYFFTGRMGDDGQISEYTPGARRTLKILSGTRFQWVAYNMETKQFSGTGGGTYTSVDGKYTENIEFFSRDNSRVGASLDFNYELKDGKWHHTGKNSKGDDLYEVWSRGHDIGI